MAVTTIGSQLVTGELKLDPSLYSLKDSESAFLKQSTKITDDEELREHVLAVQREAFEASEQSQLLYFR